MKVVIFRVGLKPLCSGYITKENSQFKPWYNGCQIGGDGTFSSAASTLKEFLIVRLQEIKAKAEAESNDCARALALFNDDQWMNQEAPEAKQ